jgi:membrane fusion protein (multidrug efflux system)
MKELWETPGGEAPTVSQSQYDSAVFKHQQTLASQKAAESRLAEANAKVEESSSELKEAREAQRYAEERLKETVIRAPYHAVVTKRLVDPGESVTTMPVTRLLEIQEIGTVELEFSLPQNMLSQVQRGTPVEFDVEGIEEARYPGEISVVYPDLDEATRSFRCRVLVENSDLKFRPGLLAQVYVVVRQAKDALIIPPKALSQTAQGWQVLVSNKGHPAPRDVQVGLMTEEAAEVLSGLSEGDEVLVPKSN